MHTDTPFSTEHLLDDDALLGALLRKAHALIDALKSETMDSAALGRVVYEYVAGAVNAGISRARIRDALELLVHDHGGSRWFGRATAIAELAMQGHGFATSASPAPAARRDVTQREGR